mgnify:CR=1 FL=1
MPFTLLILLDSSITVLSCDFPGHKSYTCIFFLFLILHMPAHLVKMYEYSIYALVVTIESTSLQGPAGKASISSVPTAAHSRLMRKGSSDHLVLNIGRESERLITAQDSDDKGNSILLCCLNNHF